MIDPSRGHDGPADIIIENGRVAAVGKELKPLEKAEIIDAAGLIVTPGLIDIHVHLRDPGQEYKEDIYSGARAAAAGGFTAIASMPNTDPVADNPSVISYIRERAETAAVRVYPIGAVTKGQAGKEMAEMGRMKKAGAAAFSDDGKPVCDSNLMRNALDYSSGLDALIIVHEEEPRLAAGGSMHEGAVSALLGLRGIPAAAEETMLARDLMLLELTGARLHIAHVSTAGSVELLRRAKARGLRVTAEVTPHHLLLTDSIVKETGYCTSTKVNPPLRTEADCKALIKGLLDGTIDAIASDHAPHHPDDKDVEYDFAPFGIAGLESSLPLLLDLISSGEEEGFTLPLLIEKMSTAPAGILQVPGGTLAPGSVADITIIDPEQKVEIKAGNWYSKSRNTPFDGRHLKGAAVYTIVGGEIVMKEGVPAENRQQQQS